MEKFVAFQEWVKENKRQAIFFFVIGLCGLFSFMVSSYFENVYYQIFCIVISYFIILVGIISAYLIENDFIVKMFVWSLIIMLLLSISFLT